MSDRTYSTVRMYNPKLQQVEFSEVPADATGCCYTTYSPELAPFVQHVRQFFDGERSAPVTKAPSISDEALYFTFSSDFYRCFLEDLEKVKVPYRSALKYGFRGYSKGGKNGVFLLRKEDKKLWTATASLIQKYREEIVSELDCTFDDLSSLRRIKIVYHEPSGERVVGVMNQENCTAVFLDFAHY